MFLPSNYAFTLAINIIIFLVLYKLHSVNRPLEFLFLLILASRYPGAAFAHTGADLEKILTALQMGVALK